MTWRPPPMGPSGALAVLRHFWNPRAHECTDAGTKKAPPCGGVEEPMDIETPNFRTPEEMVLKMVVVALETAQVAQRMVDRLLVAVAILVGINVGITIAVLMVWR